MYVLIIQWHEGHDRHEEAYGPVDVPADALAHDELIERYREAWRAEHPDAPRPHISLVGIREPI